MTAKRYSLHYGVSFGNPYADMDEDADGEWQKFGTCKTCKWWSDVRETGFVEHHQCLNPAIGFGGADGLAVDAAGGDYCLSTGPDFGCIHHEEKS